MDHSEIINHSLLISRLSELKTGRGLQETALKISVTEFIATIDLVSLFKRPDSSNNNQSSNEIIKTGLNMALNLVTGLLLGKNRSIKGYLSALMVERFTTMVIDNNLINIVAGISSMIFKKRNQDNNPT